MIKLIPSESLDESYELIVSAFKSVADEIGATPDNCPGNSAFMSRSKFAKEINKMKLYGYYDPDLVGCIGLVKKSEVTYKIKILCVKEDKRHNGIGKALVEFIETKVSGKLKLGMIYENQTLFKWYQSLGYEVEKIKTYKGNKFRLAYMEKRIEETV